MNYKAAMKTADKPKWDLAVDEEHERMIKMGVWEAVPRSKVPKDSKVISTTWAMKKEIQWDIPGKGKCAGVNASFWRTL